jgi:hypothetical protein
MRNAPDTWQAIAGAIARREPVAVQFLDVSGVMVAYMDGRELLDADDGSLTWLYRSDGEIDVHSVRVRLSDQNRSFRLNQFNPAHLFADDTLSLRVSWQEGETGFLEEEPVDASNA